jgi:hypothetical protein
VDPDGVAHLICLALLATTRAPADDDATDLLEHTLTERLGADLLADVRAALGREPRDATVARLRTSLSAIPAEQQGFLVMLAGDVLDAHGDGTVRKARTEDSAPVARDRAPGASPSDVAAVVRAERRHVADIERMLGPDHPDAVTARLGLATVYRWAGRDHDALRALERVVADRERLLGPGHPDTATARATLREWART